ncbi:GNAT family N-acetyltransferase [Candidatus Izemoplasma sp. B36]|uniref:GNAT family N-acetyltransferase n=1 Tax=Candidatus Izemoplasma sp. B36 TaxID=3242468 RepID=UPI0035565AD9
MSIRRLTTNDYHIYKEIRLEMLKNEPSNFGSSFSDESKFQDKQWIDRLSKDNVFTLGKFDNQKIVGITVLVLSPREKMRHGATIYSIYVRQDYRNKGFAQELINKATDLARENQVEIVNLSVVTHNKKALYLYNKLGFSIYGEEPKMIKYNGKYINQYLLFKEIK